MKSIIINALHQELQIIGKEAIRLDKKLTEVDSKIKFAHVHNKDGDLIELRKKEHDIKSKLFWLGSLSGKIKSEISEYEAILERINLITIK